MKGRGQAILCMCMWYYQTVGVRVTGVFGRLKFSNLHSTVLLYTTVGKVYPNYFDLSSLVFKHT